jgi:hypothetical protein
VSDEEEGAGVVLGFAAGVCVAGDTLAAWPLGVSACEGVALLLKGSAKAYL